MEWIRRMKCKRALFTIAFINLLAAALLSVFSFWVCLRVNAKISSHTVEIRMNGGSLDVAPREIAATPSRTVIAGEILSVLQILLPIAFFVIAMLVTASLFYRLKLEEPLEILTKGAARIMENDLDFEIEAGSDDELGQLCSAFETMRQSLLKNNRELWRQTEERKRLNAAFAHDLRNPLTVLKGSVKMARQCCGEANLVQREAVGECTGMLDLLTENLIRIESYTDRIERYVEIMSQVGKLEEIVADRVPVEWDKLVKDMESAMGFVVSDNGKQLDFSATGADASQRECILLDQNMLFQIAENLVSNAIRFAMRQITVRLVYEKNMLSLEVADDGSGFPEELLKQGVKPFQKGGEENGHFGMGLYICDLLCRKHGGSLTIQNLSSGACVCVAMNVSDRSM